MKLTVICIILSHISFIGCLFDKGVAMSDSKIIPLTINDCEDYNTIVWADIELKTADGKKSLDVSLNSDVPLDNTYTISLKVDKWVNGAWQENIYNTDGNWCDLIKRYAKKAWANLRNQIVPPIKEECRMEAGSYKLKNFEVSPGDFDIPSTMFGTFRLNFKVLNSEGENYFCQMVEVQSDRQ